MFRGTIRLFGSLLPHLFFIWFYLIFASLLSLDKSIGISHSILFLRFFLFAIALQYWVLSRPNYLKTLLYLLTISFGLVLFDTLIQFLNFDPVKVVQGVYFQMDLTNLLLKLLFLISLISPHQDN